MFDTYKLGFTATFWRSNVDQKGVVTDWVLCRSPIFSDSIGASPSRTLAIYSPRTVYLGVMMSFVPAVFMGLLYVNPWAAPVSSRLRRLVDGVSAWYDYADIHHDMRMGTITPKMPPPSD
eukprot:4870172-Pyramimonas_sp.AAC.1